MEKKPAKETAEENNQTNSAYGRITKKKEETTYVNNFNSNR